MLSSQTGRGPPTTGAKGWVMDSERHLAYRWTECACGPGEHSLRPVGFGFLECTTCARLFPRAGLLCEVCRMPAVFLLTRPATRRRPRSASAAFCGGCFDDFAVRGINRGWRGASGY